MLHLLEIENFFSFKDSNALDLRVKPKAGDRELFADDPAGGRVNKIAAIFGANASGKTQLLKALAFLRWWVVDSAKADPDKTIIPMSFVFDDDARSSPTRFRIEFSHGEEMFAYEVTLDSKRVLTESLRYIKIRWNIAFARTWNETDKEYEFSPATETGWRDLTVRQNASLISWGALQERPRAGKVAAFFKSIQTNLNPAGRSPEADPHFETLREAAAHFETNPDQLSWVNERLSHFDLGLAGVRIRRLKTVINGSDTEMPWPEGIHPCANGAEAYLPLVTESRGTQALFVMLRYLLPVLSSGGVAVVDEFETGLHSHMLPILTDLFLGRHNNKNAQLIFSCHSDFLLTHLDKYQVYLTGKTESGATQVWRADETGIRNQQNLYAKYHAGHLGGVPAF